MHIAIMQLYWISIYSGITAGPHTAASAGKVVLFSCRLRLKREPNSPLPSATLSRQPCGGSLWQTHTHKHLYAHNKTTQWTLLGTVRSSVLYLMLSLAVFLRINNSPTLYVPKALCCCFHHSFSKGTWSFSGNTITKTACLASLMRGFPPLGSPWGFFLLFVSLNTRVQSVVWPVSFVVNERA